LNLYNYPMFEVISWYLAIFLIGALAAPLGYFLFGRLKDYGYPFYRIIGLGFITYIAWILGSLRILPFSNLSILVSIFFLALSSFLIVHFKKIHVTKDFFRKALLYEIMFIVFCFLFIAYKLYHSEIKDIEKFMDFAFLNALLRTSYFPPQDPWFAGEPINYYYFGHLGAAVLTKLTLIKSGVTFNLMVATNYVFYVTGIFSLAYNLTKKYFWSFLAIVIAAFMGNISFIIGVLSKAEFKATNIIKVLFQEQTSVWWAEATRIIPGTINEFPLYSFLLGDLHAHYLDLPFVLTAILALFLILKEETDLIFKVFLGILFSILFITNSWDYLIYAVFLILVLLYRNGFKKEGILESLKFGSIVGGVSLIGLLPFYLNFAPGSQGIKIVTAPRTEIEHFLILFSLQMFVVAIFLGLRFYKKVKGKKDFILPFLIILGVGAFIFKSAQILPFLFILSFLLSILILEDKKINEEAKFNYVLIGMSFFIILFCEVFYLKDIYGIDFQRANTIFKLYYELWIYLSLSVVWVAYYLWEKKEKINYVFFPVAFILLLASIYYLPNSVKVSADGFQKKLGLDGTKYIENKYPYDYMAIEWLNKSVKGSKIIAEKPGNSYTDDSRISSYTGLATPLGWLGHEWGWHGSADGLVPRRDDVAKLYQTNDEKEAWEIIDRYKIDYIYMGELERKDLAINPNSPINKLGETVYKNKKVEIIKVKR